MNEINSLKEAIEKLNITLSKNRFIELSEILGNWRKLILRNFISGIVKGVGLGIGFSILTAILIILLQKIIMLNIPVISNYMADVIEIVETQQKR